MTTTNGASKYITANMMAAVNEKRGGRYGRIFTAALFIIFIFTLLFGLWVGTNVYKNLTDLQSDTATERLSLNLLANSVRNNDVSNAVGVGQGPEGKALVLTQRLDSGNYEIRYYLYDGSIVEEFTRADAAYTPESASKIVDSTMFDFSYEKGLLTIFTDQGDVKVALRSVDGGE